MSNRRILTICLAITLLLGCIVSSRAEAQTTTLQGLITKVGDGYLLLTDETLGEVRVNMDDTITTYEGVAGKDIMVVGQYAFITYNGIMTRSIPPQVTATKVSVFVVQGTVGEIFTSGYKVEGDAVLGKVLVHMGEGFPSVYQGVPITIYYNGVMALSMPPQINAVYIEVPMLVGIVSDLTDNSFTLTNDEGLRYTITIATDTRLSTVPADGETVRVYFERALQLDVGVTALEIAPDADAKDRLETD